jgi:hypothetical protein
MLLYKMSERRGIVGGRVSSYSGSSGFEFLFWDRLSWQMLLLCSPFSDKWYGTRRIKNFSLTSFFHILSIIISLYQEFIINNSFWICVPWTRLHARNLVAYGQTLCFAFRIMFRYRLESNYQDGGISCVSSVIPYKFRLKLGHGRCHPHPFQFIIFWPSCHWNRW